MRVLELFSGTATLSKLAKTLGHDTFTVDLHEPADLQADVLTLNAQDLLAASGFSGIDMLWASPPCTGFSVAAIGRNWRKDGDQYHPKSASARLSRELLAHTMNLIDALEPLTWYVENPRGMARRMSSVQHAKRVTVTYCQYGERRMKPTDIWHYSPHWLPRPACRNGDPCHEPAPRGSRSGTQGIQGALQRAKLPQELCQEVISASEKSTYAFERILGTLISPVTT